MKDITGYVRAKLELGGKREKMREVTFLADMGSWYVIVPPGLARELGIRPM